MGCRLNSGGNYGMSAELWEQPWDVGWTLGVTMGLRRQEASLVSWVITAGLWAFNHGWFLSWIQGYREEKNEGECCGRCLSTACTIQLRGGQIMTLKVGTNWTQESPLTLRWFLPGRGVFSSSRRTSLGSLLASLRLLREVQMTCGRHRVSSLILLDFCIPDKHIVGVWPHLERIHFILKKIFCGLEALWAWTGNQGKQTPCDLWN